MLADVRAIAVQAGQRILDFYAQELPVDYKSDDSPLTHADRASHAYIVQALRALTPDIPVLSEESPEDEVAGRKGWATFWLVDPLDGTKEFVKKTTGEFTVNIALIDGAEPVLGVVHVPVKGVTYFADAAGAFKQDGDAAPVPIQARQAADAALTVVASRDHAGAEVAAILDRLGDAGYAVDSASMGSSLKFCLVAEGQADFYPRTVPTFEWDTAAAQAIVEAAGGRVATRDGERLAYNKDDIRNPSVFAVGDPAFDWQRFVEQEVPS
ncbi:MAG: 3'(2'),5'-bisphosphate nucleotidase CysQ [Bacteroidota bacterium]